MNSTSILSSQNGTKTTFDIDGFFFTYIYSSISICGCITNGINIIVFMNNDFKNNNVFVYLKVHSFVEFLYLFSICLIAIPSCGNYCLSSVNKKSLFSIIISLYLDYYLSSSLAIFAILIEITICLQRFLIISNSNRFGFIRNGSAVHVLIALFIISLLYYMPEFAFYKIKSQVTTSSFDNKTHTQYSVTKTQFALDNLTLKKYYDLSADFVRGPIFISILTLINLGNLYKFNKQMEAKRKIKTGSKSKLKFIISI
jgi:hypothetical protein